MSLAAPRMVASIDICQRERPGGEHYPGRSGTLRWPQGRPLETLQRPTSVQTRAASSCRDSARSGPVKPETADQDTVKFRLKVTSKVRLNRRSFASAEHFHPLWYNTTIIVQPKWRPPCLQAHPALFFFCWSHDERIQQDSRTRAWVLHPRTPTLRGLCRALLNSHRDLKIPMREEIPPHSAAKLPHYKGIRTISLSLTRNHPRQYRTEASERCFSQTDCCV